MITTEEREVAEEIKSLIPKINSSIERALSMGIDIRWDTKTISTPIGNRPEFHIWLTKIISL